VRLPNSFRAIFRSGHAYPIDAFATRRRSLGDAPFSSGSRPRSAAAPSSSRRDYPRPRRLHCL
jgi:hypothetical protein